MAAEVLRRARALRAGFGARSRQHALFPAAGFSFVGWRGDTVATGTRIGRITDFHGNALQDVTAPFPGIVLYVLGTPPISKGEPVAFVGQVQK